MLFIFKYKGKIGRVKPLQNVHFSMEGRELDRWGEVKKLLNGCCFQGMSRQMKMFPWSVSLITMFPITSDFWSVPSLSEVLYLTQKGQVGFQAVQVKWQLCPSPVLEGESSYKGPFDIEFLIQQLKWKM